MTRPAVHYRLMGWRRPACNRREWRIESRKEEQVTCADCLKALARSASFQDLVIETIHGVRDWPERIDWFGEEDEGE